MTDKEVTNEFALEYILANYFDGDDDVKAVVGGDEESMAMKRAAEALMKQIPREMKWVVEKYETHDWQRDSKGEVDVWASENGFHNGPMCNRCYESFCIHCLTADEVENKMKEECNCSHYECPTCGYNFGGFPKKKIICPECGQKTKKCVVGR